MEFRQRVKATTDKHLTDHGINPKNKFIVYGPDLPFPPETIPQDGDIWGNWTYDIDNLTLEYNHDNRGHKDWYEVDLERCKTSAEILDWIAQVSAKPYVSRTDVGNLVMALDDLLSLQQHVCGMGTTHIVDGKVKKFDTKTYLLRRAKNQSP